MYQTVKKQGNENEPEKKIKRPQWVITAKEMEELEQIKKQLANESGYLQNLMMTNS